ncbi:Zinc finger transcription factor ace1 [Scedosporium apiospermum]|uniref:Zinc finger transcription factor ace1 n=1 Tax=Pseudallescheria apiosperma TaxID=563466 RepID=A0A084FY22_PSEDA|nr:Zinc finger transcription factor ace1 [Scedosporium apiospermum]KEZ39984.1 Zinc finger transcription factor ace1 [Scedosporium apiospermum]
MAPNPRRTTRTAVTRSCNDNKGLSLNTTVTLRKSPTFHSPTSPSSASSTFVPPSIRRSQTNLDDVVDAHRRRAALIVDDVDKSLSKNEPESPSSSSRRTMRDRSLPLPPGLLDLPVVDPAMADSERRVLRSRNRRASGNHPSDSGLGTSITETSAKRAATQGSKKIGVSAITRSAATTMSENLPGLSQRARARIQEHTLRPLLAKPSLKDFRPIVLDIPRRISDREIICLRDLEKTLIFMAPVSQLMNDPGVWGDTYRFLRLKERTKTPELYLDFCLTSVRCIQTTAEFLSEREKTRPTDRLYTNAYFMDLEDQLRQYASQLAATKQQPATATSGEKHDDMELDISDEIRLLGGLAKNGRPAELVRVKKDGRAFSMATGELVNLDDEDAKGGAFRIKRSSSHVEEEEEDILRSMARRKKNPTPEELAPKKCREPGCNKEFKRPCDLTKHEKTHSRPWKCPVKSCKYHEYGWPTEKEMDRHHNDKHSDSPAMFECHYKPCPYKSKRESNCKQHMEKAHGWTYVRTKTNRKKAANAAESSSTVHPTPQLTNMSTPESHLGGLATPGSEHSEQFMDLPDNSLTFPKFIPNDDLFNINQPPIHIPELDNMHMEVDLSPVEPFNVDTPSTGPFEHYSRFQDGTGFTLDDDLYTATAQMPTPDPALYAKVMPQQPFLAYPDAMGNAQPEYLPTPHISPIGQPSAMLYTPKSLQEVVDEGFEDFTQCDGGFDHDFALFPGATKMDSFEPLFNNEMPSAGMGYSQQSQDMLTGMDWTAHDFGAYNE